MNKDNIQPLKGFRDFLPEEAAARADVFARVRSVFARYGFLPLETPALEYGEILAGKYGDEGDKLMYQFKDQGERDVAMRYDLTVPLARVVAQYQNELAMPFKRYQIAPVWRADRPQKGRYREITQCDIDIVGTESLFADAEVIACLNAALSELGLRDVIIRVNNRKVLDGLMKASGIEAKKTMAAIRSLDKLQKIGEDGVRGELAAAGVQKKQADKLFEFLGQGLEDASDIEEKLEEVKGAGELAELVEILLDMEVKNYEVDLTLARGLDYYTGTIFEITAPDAAELGSIAGGGRYDQLIGMFAGKQIPAVGGSLGIDRVMTVLEELELVGAGAASEVLVCNLDEALEERYLAVTRQLRLAGIRTEFYYESVKLDKQLKYADKKNIKFVVLIGQNEAAKEEATVKNLSTGKQEVVKQKELGRVLKM
jgi:histidyl-tRNA synthetase